MEVLKKLLEGVSLTDEQFAKLEEGIKEHYKDFIPKHRFDEVNESKKSLENELTARDTQLNDLKASAAGNEELKKQFEALQAENQKRIEEHNAKIKELSISAAVKIALASDVHDPDLVSSLIDKSKVEIDDAGSIKAGLEDQIKSLREAKGFLFVDKQAKLPGFKGVGPRDSEGKPIEGGKNPWAKEHYNLTEQGKLLRENPELAKQMMSAAK